MSTLLTLLLSLTPATAVPLTPVTGPISGLTAAGMSQEEGEAPKPDERPEVAKLLDQLEEHYNDRKGEQDEAAVGLVDSLLQEFPESGPKDRESIVDGIADAVTVKRLLDDEDQPRDTLQIAAATALGRMGPESGPALIKLVDHKALRETLRAHGAVLKSLGRVHPEKGVKPLIEMLDHKDEELVAAASVGLAGYVEADQKVRKDIVENLLKTIIPLKDALANGEDASSAYEEARERFDAISAAVRDTLQVLTGHDEREFYAWRDWWNDNKKKDWDAGRAD
ncbi:HEAT repeat domain-containing protein [Engelhardtia mirabilis]